MSLAADLHVAIGRGAAVSLREAFAFAENELAVIDDCFGIGPISLYNDPQEFLRWRRSIEAEVDHPLDKLRTNGTVVVWAEAAAIEQLALCWLAHTWLCLGVRPRVRVSSYGGMVCGLSVLFAGELPARVMQKGKPLVVTWDEAQWSEAKSVWQSYAAGAIASLNAYAASEQTAALPALRRAIAALMHRFPAAESGLGYWDHALLRAFEHEPVVAKAIARCWMALGGEAVDSMGEIELLQRIRRLSNPDAPQRLLAVSRATRDDLRAHAELTDAAFAVLAGRLNAVDAVGLDEWVGGYHLTPETCVFQRGGRLVLE